MKGDGLKWVRICWCLVIVVEGGVYNLSRLSWWYETALSSLPAISSAIYCLSCPLTSGMPLLTYNLARDLPRLTCPI